MNIRNQLCPCGSLKKYKKCCFMRDFKMEQECIERKNRKNVFVVADTIRFVDAEKAWTER